MISFKIIHLILFIITFGPLNGIFIKLFNSYYVPYDIQVTLKGKSFNLKNNFSLY